jgi:hypothetical protein
MQAQRFEGKTRTIGIDQKGVYPLHIRDSYNHEMQCNQMQSVWKPTKEELEVLNNDGFVMLIVVGIQHPPVQVEVLRNE